MFMLMGTLMNGKDVQMLVKFGFVRSRDMSSEVFCKKALWRLCSLCNSYSPSVLR